MSELAVLRNDETQKTQVDPETAERFIAEKADRGADQAAAG